MAASIPTEGNLALNFVRACLEEKNPEKMRKFTSANFTCTSAWTYGKHVTWDNIEQMIGAFKLAPWTATCEDFSYKVLGESIVEANHLEKPNLQDSTTFSKVFNAWAFVFCKDKDTGENKIEYLTINTHVEKV